MFEKPSSKNEQIKSQVEVDENILNLLGNQKINTQEDITTIIKLIHNYLEFKPYNKETEKHADSIQWKRTASEIIKDKYVYEGKSCSDLAIIFLAICKAAGIEGRLVKLSAINGDQTHSIVEFKLNDKWYRVDTSDKDAKVFEGELTAESNWNGFKVWKKGRDVWDLGLEDVDSELEIYEKTKK